MSNIMLVSILSSLFCCQSNNDIKRVENKKAETNIAESLSVNAKTITNQKNEIINETVSSIVPDTTINSKLYLENFESLSRFYSKDKSLALVEKLRESPVVVFLSKSKKEYLLAYQYEGNTENTFSCFEIGYVKDEKGLANVKSVQTSETDFKTESGLHLGMNLENLKKIKGSNLEATPLEGFTITKYKIDNFETSMFLKRYNMPGYFIEAHSKNNIICKIKFGFDYP